MKLPPRPSGQPARKAGCWPTPFRAHVPCPVSCWDFRGTQFRSLWHPPSGSRGNRGPLCAQRRGACDRQHGGAVAAVARPRRPADHRAARSAHCGCYPRRRNLCRPLRVRRQDRNLPRPVDLRSRAAVGRLGSRPARLRLAAPPARRRHRVDPRQCPLAGR